MDEVDEDAAKYWINLVPMGAQSPLLTEPHD